MADPVLAPAGRAVMVAQPRRASTRAERREEALHALLAAADELGVRFGELPMERLAREAGMSRATFYIYFEDKLALVRGWSDLVERRVDEATRDWSEHDGPVAWEQVRSTLAALTDVRVRHRTAIAAIEDMAVAAPELRDVRARARAARVESLRRHVRRGQHGGWIDGGLRPEPTAAWLTAMIDRVTEHVLPGTASDQVERLIDTGTDIVWTTLYGAPD